jgi:hypothetical protein
MPAMPVKPLVKRGTREPVMHFRATVSQHAAVERVARRFAASRSAVVRAAIAAGLPRVAAADCVRLRPTKPA